MDQPMLARRLAALGVAAALIFAMDGARSADAQPAPATRTPTFEIDALWPRPLPNHWVIGSTVGVSVDAKDNVWIVHRPNSVEDPIKGATTKPPESECCVPAPPVLQFDSSGNLLQAWGGPGAGSEWPESEHGIMVDYKGNVWIGGNGQTDTQILKFSPAGKFILQIGQKGKHEGNADTNNLWRPASMFVDSATNELYVADGYGNRRIIVFDADTGAFKRQWGAYGAKPEDANIGPYDPAAPPAKQFRTPHCAIVSADRFVYVCDRLNNRIQVFKTDGTFVREAVFAPNTRRQGAVWDLTFSRDRGQTYLYMADGSNQRVTVLQRSSLTPVSAFGDGGRRPGQFVGVHNLATDSQGNLYTTETFSGARVQRFVFKGIRKADQSR